MNTFNKVILVIGILLMLPLGLQASERPILDDQEGFTDDQLVKAVYEVSLLSSIMRNLPSNPKLNFDGTLLRAEGAFKNRIQQAPSLLNFVCAQVYVNHLKDLRALSLGKIQREDLDLTNHYNRNDLTLEPRRLSAASARGAQRGAELVTEGDRDKIVSICVNFMSHLWPFLCSEFENSYRKLFDLKEANVQDIQNPYYSLFCKMGEDKTDMKDGLK